MNNRSLDIIIVNWNSGHYLANCINSILRSNKNNIILEIIIIDNASSDNSIESVPVANNIKIIKNNINKGFSAACNQGITFGKSDYILFLNPDTEVFPDTIVKSINLIQKNKDIWILGVKHLDKDNRILPSCSRFPELKNYIFDITGLSKIFPKIFTPATLMTDWDHNSERYVDQVMGAYMLLCRSTLTNIGIFDERYYVYYEDMDLSLRVKKQGGQVFYTPDIQIYHKGGGTSNQVKDKRLFYSILSRLLFAQKHFSQITFYILVAMSLLIEPFTRMLRSLIRFRPKEIKNIFKAYILLSNELKQLLIR